MLHAAALASIERYEDAKIVVQRLIELQPGITIANTIVSARIADAKNIGALANVLRRAGLPEG